MLASETEDVERRIEEPQVRDLTPDEERLRKEIMAAVIRIRERGQHRRNE